MDLTNEQWSVLELLIGELPKQADGRYPPYQTCHRRFWQNGTTTQSGRNLTAIA